MDSQRQSSRAAKKKCENVLSQLWMGAPSDLHGIDPVAEQREEVPAHEPHSFDPSRVVIGRYARHDLPIRQLRHVSIVESLLPRCTRERRTSSLFATWYKVMPAILIP